MPRDDPCWFATSMNASPALPENALAGPLNKPTPRPVVVSKNAVASTFELLSKTLSTSELEPVTAFENCLTIDERHWPHRLAAENNLIVFETRNTLNPVFLSTRSECGFHTCARVGVKLNAEPRCDSVSATRADEA